MAGTAANDGPRWWRRLAIGYARRARLASTITELEKAYANHPGRSDPDLRSFIDSADVILKAAREALGADLNTGWSLVHRAERTIAAADNQDQLCARAVRLRAEACEKLSGWRQKAAVEGLGDPGKATLPGVQMAMDMMNEHAANQYHKAELLTGQLLVIGLITGVLILAVLGVSYANVRPLGDYAESLSWAALFGALGGTLSAARSLTEGTKSKRIPEQVYSWPITLARPLVGAAAGIGAFLLLLAGVVSVAALDTQLAAVSAGFLAGFSERYFLSLIPSGEKGKE